jgi:hypothetical protein
MTPLMHKYTSKFSCVAAATTLSIEIDIPIEISIAVIVDIHVRHQFALKPTVTGQSTASYFNNFIDLVESSSRRISVCCRAKSRSGTISTRRSAEVNST